MKNSVIFKRMFAIALVGMMGAAIVGCTKDAAVSDKQNDKSVAQEVDNQAEKKSDKTKPVNEDKKEADEKEEFTPNEMIDKFLANELEAIVDDEIADEYDGIENPSYQKGELVKYSDIQEKYMSEDGQYGIEKLYEKKNVIRENTDSPVLILSYSRSEEYSDENSILLVIAPRENEMHLVQTFNTLDGCYAVTTVSEEGKIDLYFRAHGGFSSSDYYFIGKDGHISKMYEYSYTRADEIPYSNFSKEYMKAYSEFDMPNIALYQYFFEDGDNYYEILCEDPTYPDYTKSDLAFIQAMKDSGYHICSEDEITEKIKQVEAKYK